MCAGQLSLAEGQRLLATDWTQLLPQAQRSGMPTKAHVGDDESDDGP